MPEFSYSSVNLPSFVSSEMAEVRSTCRSSLSSAAIEFLTAEKVAAIEIHRRMLAAYGAETVDVSTVRRWARRMLNSEEDVGQVKLKDEKRSGRPQTASDQQHQRQIDDLIRQDRSLPNLYCRNYRSIQGTCPACGEDARVFEGVWSLDAKATDGPGERMVEGCFGATDSKI